MQAIQRVGQLANHAVSGYAKGHMRGQALGGHLIKGADYGNTAMEGLHVHNLLVEANQISSKVPKAVATFGEKYHEGSESVLKPRRRAAAAEIRARDLANPSAQQRADVAAHAERMAARGGAGAAAQHAAMRPLRQTNEVLRQRTQRGPAPGYQRMYRGRPVEEVN